VELEHPGTAWGPILAAAAGEAGLPALEYVGPAGDAAEGAVALPELCFGAGAGAVLWAATDDSSLAGELATWLQGCAAALGLPEGGPQDMTPPPEDAVVLAFRTESGATATLWLAAAVLGATDPAPAAFPQLGAAVSAADGAAGIDLLLEVPMVLTVELGRTERQIRDVLALQRGSIVELDRLAGEPVDLMVNGHLIAHAEVVVVDENFGVRITDVVSPAERIRHMQGRT
jgi:flagellar motor switch protein FliN